ncbi:MAG: hypothetical protein ACXWAC_05690 [Usitatibacter sp.]
MNSLSTHQGVKTAFLSSLGRITAGVVLGLALVGISGCAAFKPRPAEEIVMERAQARWDALVKGDLPAAYGFFSPGSRAVLTQEQYSNSIRLGFWKSAKVEKVECATQDSCFAHVAIEYEFQGRRTKTPLGETWIREGSDWWYIQK